MTATTHRSHAAPRRRWLPAASLVALVLILAACGAGAGADPAPIGEAPMDGDQSATRGDAVGGAEDNGAPAFAALADRQIVKTGEVTLEVASVASAVGSVRAMALELGGYVGGSRSGSADEPATLTLRIPADRFDAAISRLHELDAEVVVEATREEDVTATVVDLEARIRNLQASETQYRALLERATEIEDILTVQSRLDEVRGRIEQLQAQLDQVSGLADLATLTVTLIPAATAVEETAEGWDAGAIFESAVATLVGLGQSIATAAIWLGVVGLPLAVVGGFVVLVALRAAPVLRRPAAPASDPEPVD